MNRIWVAQHRGLRVNGEDHDYGEVIDPGLFDSREAYDRDMLRIARRSSRVIAVPESMMDLDALDNGANVARQEIDATAAAEELAENLGLDLTQVEGTGKAGRILKSDVEAHVA